MIDGCVGGKQMGGSRKREDESLSSGKKNTPLSSSFVYLFIYLFVVVANWLSVAASSAWMPPPLRKIKGGQGVGGGRSLGGGGSGGGLHM